MPKARSANFTLRKIAQNIPAGDAAHRFAALQRSGAYSELRFIQRGKSAFDIVGYKWPDKGVRRRLGTARNPLAAVGEKYRRLAWSEATPAGRLAVFFTACADAQGVDIQGDGGLLVEPEVVKLVCDHIHFMPEKEAADLFAGTVKGWWDRVRSSVRRLNPSPESLFLNWSKTSPPAWRSHPMYAAAHEGKGLEIVDGKYRLKLSPAEVAVVVRQIKKVWPDSTHKDFGTFFDQRLSTWWGMITGMIDLERSAGRTNPSLAGEVSPNQVLFGMNGKTLVGWINRETPTRYEVSYKVGTGLRHVWREKSKVKFMKTGKRGRVVNKCPVTANPDTPLERAKKLSAAFHGFEPRQVHRMKIEWPKAVMLIGPCLRLDYYSEKYDNKGRVYFHEFEKPVAIYAAESPQPDGSNLLIIQGKFKIRPEGITG